jgi:hypothetical protein
VSLRFPPKTAYEELTYSLDFSDWLNPDATLASAVWIVPAGLTMIASAVNASTGRASIKLGGGTVNTEYLLRCQAVASDGEKPERMVRIRVISPKPL